MIIDKKMIIASKLFSGSDNKSQILSALDSQINKELLQQKATDINLPEPKQEQEPKGSSVDNKAADEQAPAEDTGKSSGVKDVTSKPKPMKFKYAGKGEASDDSHSDTDTPEQDSSVESENDGIKKFKAEPMDDDEAAADTNSKETDSDVESSTKAGGDYIKASSNFDYVSDNVNVIKETLNSREDTGGVVSASLKNDDSNPELWLYYNDDINLNDMIYSVVSLFNATGYTMLKFNRLARSNNAMVFDILYVSDAVKSVNEISDEQEG